MLIAIDGAGGVGKSTVARGVAADTGLPHLNTGLTYRAATIAALDAAADVADEAAVLAAVRVVSMEVEGETVSLDGRDVTTSLRSDEVTAAVSAVSAHPAVRAHIVGVQRAWVEDHGGGAVVEGRDIGSVVFPNAPVKVFLTARPEVRAMRRLGDRESAGKDAEEVAADLARRDRIDSTREASPLKPADDAVEIDTSDMTAEEVIDAVLELVHVVRRTERYEMGAPD